MLDGSQLAAALADANAAAGRYSRVTLAAQIGAGVELIDGAATSFETASLLGPGVVGLIEHLVAASPPERVGQRRQGPSNLAPDALVRVLAADGLVELRAVQDRHRFLRRLLEHLRRLGWSDVSIDIVLLGPGGRLEVPAAPRSLVVQAHGSSFFDGPGTLTSFEPAMGCAMAGLAAELRCSEGMSIVVVVVAERVDEPTGGVVESTDLLARAHEPPSSTARLVQLLHLEELAARGVLDPQAILVRGRHPAGAYAVEGVPGEIACGGEVWRVHPSLQSALGRILSGPPVSGQELGELAGLGPQEAVAATLALARCGLCEPCDGSEPLV
jgi:hypothetical protein